MKRIDYYRLMNKLTSIERNIKIAGFMRKEKSEQAKYPDLRSLMAIAETYKIECNMNMKYECTSCLTKKRNKCWNNSQRVDRKKMILAGIPYERTILGNMKISDLWILAAHLKITPVFGSKSQLVDRIIKRQYKLREEEKFVPVKVIVEKKKVLKTPKKETKKNGN